MAEGGTVQSLPHETDRIAMGTIADWETYCCVVYLMMRFMRRNSKYTAEYASSLAGRSPKSQVSEEDIFGLGGQMC